MPIVFLMRHGQAELHAPSDAERPLSAYGKAYSAQIAQQLSDILTKQKLPAPVVLHSPYRRAVETVREIENVLGILAKVSITKATPDDHPGACFDALADYAGESFILVSHMPLLASLASLIERGNSYESQPFQTSEIRAYHIEHWWAPGCGEFKFRLA